MTEQSAAPEVKWGEWIGGGWQMLMARWQVWVPMMLVFILAVIVPIAPGYMLILGAALASRGGEAPSAAVGFAPLLVLAGVLISICLSALMMGGVYRTAFKQMRGETISIGDLFSGKDLTVNMLLTLLLVGLCTIGGAFLCIIPAYIVGGLLMFSVPLVVERRLSPVDALRASFEKTKGNWLMFTLFAFVLALIAGAGAIACYVGMLLTYPLYFLVTAVAYRDVFGVAGAQGGAQQMPNSYASPSWQQGGQPSYMPPPPQYTPPQAPQSYMPPVMPPAPVASDQMACPNCNALLARTAKFCNYCGKPL